MNKMKDCQFPPTPLSLLRCADQTYGTYNAAAFLNVRRMDPSGGRARVPEQCRRIYVRGDRRAKISNAIVGSLAIMIVATLLSLTVANV